MTRINLQGVGLLTERQTYNQHGCSFVAPSGCLLVVVDYSVALRARSSAHPTGGFDQGVCFDLLGQARRQVAALYGDRVVPQGYLLGIPELVQVVRKA